MRKMNFTSVLEKFALTLAVVFLMSGQIFAQEEENEISDEDLKAFAAITTSVEVITSSVKPSLLNMIEQQEGMTTKRYMELQKGEGEPAKEWENNFLKLIKEMAAKRQEAAKEVLNIIINNSTLTSAKYAAIKGKINSDSDLKARYSEVTASLF